MLLIQSMADERNSFDIAPVSMPSSPAKWTLNTFSGEFLFASLCQIVRHRYRLEPLLTTIKNWSLWLTFSFKQVIRPEQLSNFSTISWLADLLVMESCSLFACSSGEDWSVGAASSLLSRSDWSYLASISSFSTWLNLSVSVSDGLPRSSI